MTAKKPEITIRIRLACGFEYAVDSRPNPRKAWPDAQTCPDCKRKHRVVEIHTSNPSAVKDSSMKLTAKPKRKRTVKPKAVPKRAPKVTVVKKTVKKKGTTSGNRKRKS